MAIISWTGGASSFTNGTTADADDIETLKTNITTQVNGSLNAANLADGAVTTAKLAAAAVDATKLGNLSVLEASIDYTSANSGPKVVRIADYAGADGAIIAATNHAFIRNGTAQETLTITFATSMAYGDPGFSAAPIPLGGPILTDGTGSVAAADEIQGYFITSLTNLACNITINLQGATATGLTLNMGFLGPV